MSAAPLDPRFPGGFAARHAAFASAVARQYQTELIYVHDGDEAAFRTFSSSPKGLLHIHLLDGSGATGRDDPRNPRQSVARRMHWSSEGRDAPLLVTLTASVAHLGLLGPRAMAVLEEGWERVPTPAERPGSEQRALHVVERLRYRSLYRRIGQSAVRVVAITERERRHFGRFMPEDRICVVPFGVDTRYFAPVSAPERDIDVLIVGAVNRAEQRVEDLVHELHRRPATRNARCVIVGGAPRPSILSLASATVDVVGYVADVRPYYARAKIVAIPTFTDVGIKTTMLEAWAMERPVVTSQSVLAASDRGAFQANMAVTTVEAMGPVIARLLGDAGQRERLGRLGRRVVLAHHEEQRSAQQFARSVDGVLSSR